MLDIEVFQEIFNSIKQNITRSILAGFGVAWGIFILIILLGAGQGFQNGIMKLFSVFAQKSIWIYGGQTSLVYCNENEGKAILFDKAYLDNVKKRYEVIEAISPEVNYNGYLQVTSQQKAGSFQLKGVWCDYFKIKLLKPEFGRLLNRIDNKEIRRVAVIGQQVAKTLFPNESALNKYINVSGNYFKIIGILESGSIFSMQEINNIYIPYECFIDCFNQGKQFNVFGFILKKDVNPTNFETTIRSYLAHQSGFDVKDNSAMYILNFENQIKGFEKLFAGIKIFLWFIGLCLLLSGMVGISNIMFVIVKERTYEIGIRKAIGATPKSILWLLLLESILITSTAGIIGLVLGGGCIFFINYLIKVFMTSKDSIMSNATIDIPVIITALFILILSGTIAGFLPAKKASDIMPVDAIRDEGR